MSGWIIGGTALASAGLNYIGSKKAADAAATGQRDANAVTERIAAEDRALQEEMWNYQMDEFQPWKEAGYLGLAGYENLLMNPEKIQYDPGYQFGLSQGVRAVDSSASAQGMNLSGATLKGLTRYGQDYGQTYYDQALSRFQPLMNLGSAAAAGVSGATQAFGSNMSGISSNLSAGLAQGYQNLGDIGAASAMAPYNAISSGINTGLSVYGMRNFAGGGAGTVTAPTIVGSGSGGYTPQGIPGAEARLTGMYG